MGFTFSTDGLYANSVVCYSIELYTWTLLGVVRISLRFRSFLLNIWYCMSAIALPLQDWYTLRHFGINAYSPTRRGRSGTCKIRTIAVIITKHGYCNQTRSRDCQIGNLVPVYCGEFITTLIRQRCIISNASWLGAKTAGCQST